VASRIKPAPANDILHLELVHLDGSPL
jgi:hypothetical protein